MPELPEVETSRRGIAPHLQGQRIRAAIVRTPKLRWPIPPLAELLPGQHILTVERRAKYLLIRCSDGTLIVHLGMSGSLRVLPADTPAAKHDHFDLVFNNQCLRLRDPRRFGALLWTTESPDKHELIRSLGPEPLSDSFDGDYLWTQAQGRKIAIKALLMDGKVVVGIGNIYATEALFMAGIHPGRPCHRIAKKRLQALVNHSKSLLAAAIEKGGTTLRDFQKEDGKPGYFAQQLQVYGRAGEHCPKCSTPIKSRLIGQRASAYCSQCQR